MSRNKIFDIIVSVIAGFAIWAYVVSVQDPVTTGVVKSVPVQLVNTEVMSSAGMAIAGSGQYTVDLSISANRSTINSVSASDFTATADVAQLTTVGQNYITVEVEAPATVSISEIRTQRIQVYVDKLVTVDKYVCINTEGLEEGYELGSVGMSVSYVSVTGAESLVNSVVDVLATVDVSEKAQDESFSEDYEIIPVDSAGNRVWGVSLSQKAVNITACKYAIKEVALTVPVNGVLGEHLAIRSEIIPASVSIKGPQSVLDSIWVVYSEPIDIASITGSCSIPLSFYLYEGVELADASKNIAVSYELKGRKDLSYSYTIDDIIFVNAPEGFDIISEDSFTLACSVFDDEAESFVKENILLTVDMSILTNPENPENPEGPETVIEAGEYQLPIQMSVAEGYTDVLVNGLPEALNFRLDVSEAEEITETSEAAITAEE